MVWHCAYRICLDVVQLAACAQLMHAFKLTAAASSAYCACTVSWSWVQLVSGRYRTLNQVVCATHMPPTQCCGHGSVWVQGSKRWVCMPAGLQSLAKCDTCTVMCVKTIFTPLLAMDNLAIVISMQLVCLVGPVTHSRVADYHKQLNLRGRAFCTVAVCSQSPNLSRTAGLNTAVAAQQSTASRPGAHSFKQQLVVVVL